MDAQELRNLQEAYNQVYQVDESSISDRAKNAVADQRLSDAQSSTQRSVDRLRNMPTVTRSTAALAARAVERDVKKSNSYGPQRPTPGTVTGRRIEKPKPTGSKPKVSRLGGSSSLSGVGGSAATGGYQVGGSRGYGISGIRLADHYDVYDIILSHLLDEGYAETPRSAEIIMVNMSEEWRQTIMKTFKQFQEQLSLSQAFARAGKPGIPSEPPSSTTSLRSLARRTASDRARPKGNTSGVPTIPLNKSSYEGRKEAGRNPKYADNPDYTGPLTGAGSGTKDRMPGTTPSNNPQLSPRSTKPITKTIPKSSNFI